MGGKSSNKIEETAEEKELAKIAMEKWEFQQEHLNPLVDTYMAKTDAMKTRAAYGYTAGRVNEQGQIGGAQLRQQVGEQSRMAGLDPSSGRAMGIQQEAMNLGAQSTGETGGRAAMEQTNQYVKGQQTITNIGLGRASEAQAGLGQIASQAGQQAQQDAFTTFNRNSANMQLLGGLAGIGTSAYLNRSPKPDKRVGLYGDMANAGQTAGIPNLGGY